VGWPRAGAEIAELRHQVEDLRSALAVHSGGVDAVMTGEPGRPRLQALASTDRPHRILVEQMGEGAATVSQRGVILYVNPSLAALLQRTPGELVGSNAAALADPADRPALAALLTTGPSQTKRSELGLARTDGTRVPVIAAATQLDVEGVPVFGLIAVDISERLRSEQLLAAANAQLAARSADLERANADLARSNEELAQFAFVAGHDLKAPLMCIGGFADLLSHQYSERLDPAGAELLDAIIESTGRMQDLITDLLAYSRVDAEVPAFQPVDTAQLLATVLTDLGPRIDGLDARVTLGSLPVVTGDPVQLAEVFTNLIGNAFTYVAPGVVPHVHVTAEPEAGYARFTVADNGIGIEPTQREHVFTMFKRLHSEETYSGTGIGLAIVQKVVERHGGRIWIEDNPGGGTAMCFTIPMPSS
jgi:PAS domain S-box-containing protein